MEKCSPGIIDATGDVIVLGVELFDGIVKRTPQMVKDTLKDKPYKRLFRKL